MQVTKPVKAPRKQRKLLHNAPAHLRHKRMAAPLSPELAASKGVKTLPVRKGDSIRIMRGDHKGFEGKISRVDLKNYRIYVEGLTREKVDGTNVFVSVHPSKVMIRNLNLDDKLRKEIVERKRELEQPQKEEKIAEKPARKAEKVEKAAKKPPTKVAKVAEAKEVKELKEEKPVVVEEKIVEAKVTIEKKTEEAKPKAKLTKAKKKPVPKRKEAKTVKEEKPAEKKGKPKAAKKIRTKRKTASEKEGGT